MTTSRRITSAAHALTHNQEVWADHGYAVLSGSGLSAGPTDFEIDLAAHTVTVGGLSAINIQAQTFGVDPPSNNPYWLLVYVDGNGDLQTTTSAEAAIEPAGWSEAEEITAPLPPALYSEGPVTVLGRALVTSAGVADSRIVNQTFDGSRVFDAAEIDTASIDEATLGTLQDTLDVNEQDLNNIASAFAELVETKVSQPTERQYLPQYSDVANAPQEAPSIIEVPPGSATTPAGIYAYNPEVGEYEYLQGDVTVQNTGQLSDLSIDTVRDWGGYGIENLGPLGSEANPVSGTSHMEAASVEKIINGAGIERQAVLKSDNDASTNLSLQFSSLSNRVYRLIGVFANESGSNTDLRLRFNGNSTSNYNFKNLDSNTTTTDADLGFIGGFGNDRATAIEMFIFDGSTGSVDGNFPSYHSRQVMTEFDNGADYRGRLAVEDADLSSFEIFAPAVAVGEAELTSIGL